MSEKIYQLDEEPDEDLPKKANPSTKPQSDYLGNILKATSGKLIESKVRGRFKKFVESNRGSLTPEQSERLLLRSNQIAEVKSEEHSRNPVNRRRFASGLAAGAASLAAGSGLKFALDYGRDMEASQKWNETVRRETEVLVNQFGVDMLIPRPGNSYKEEKSGRSFVVKPISGIKALRDGARDIKDSLFKYPEAVSRHLLKDVELILVDSLYENTATNPGAVKSESVSYLVWQPPTDRLDVKKTKGLVYLANNSQGAEGLELKNVDVALLSLSALRKEGIFGWYDKEAYMRPYDVWLKKASEFLSAPQTAVKQADWAEYEEKTFSLIRMLCPGITQEYLQALKNSKI